MCNMPPALAQECQGWGGAGAELPLDTSTWTEKSAKLFPNRNLWEGIKIIWLLRLVLWLLLLLLLLLPWTMEELLSSCKVKQQREQLLIVPSRPSLAPSRRRRFWANQTPCRLDEKFLTFEFKDNTVVIWLAMMIMIALRTEGECAREPYERRVSGQ